MPQFWPQLPLTDTGWQSPTYFGTLGSGWSLPTGVPYPARIRAIGRTLYIRNYFAKASWGAVETVFTFAAQWRVPAGVRVDPIEDCIIYDTGAMATRFAGSAGLWTPGSIVIPLD